MKRAAAASLLGRRTRYRTTKTLPLRKSYSSSSSITARLPPPPSLSSVPSSSRTCMLGSNSLGGGTRHKDTNSPSSFWQQRIRLLPLPLLNTPQHHRHRRHYLSTSSSSSSQEQQQQQPSKEEQQAIHFLITIGHDTPGIAQGVVGALKESGATGSSLLPMLQSLAGRWEVGEDGGLEDLVEAVRVQQLQRDGRNKIRLLVVPASAWKSSEEDAEDYADIVETPEEYQEALKRAFPVEAMTGLTLTDVAKHGKGPGAQHLGESIECACAGIMACSTCHVVIDPKWFDNKDIGVEEPSESESDMLDLAYAPRRTSRLACQIVLDESMDGMVIRLPKGANNLMDFVPFSE